MAKPTEGQEVSCQWEQPRRGMGAEEKSWEWVLKV